MRISIPIATGGGRSNTRMPLPSASLKECIGHNGRIDRAKAQLAIEIDDDRLHIMMLRLGLYECSASDRVKQIKLLKRKIFSGKNAPVRISPNKNKYSAHEKKSKISH